MKRPVVGMEGLRRPVPDEAWGRYSARPVRSLDELQMAAAIRAAVFMSEQASVSFACQKFSCRCS